MNYLVPLDAGELEKILSGVKTMILKEFDPAQPTAPPTQSDNLYFLRNKDEWTLRVTTTIVRVLTIMNELVEDLSQVLKEMQPRLQLTEDQYNYWSAKKQIMLVEFNCAHKIDVIHVTPHKIKDRSDWIAFEEFSQIVD